MNEINNDDLPPLPDGNDDAYIQKNAVEALKHSKFAYAHRNIENGTVSLEKVLEDFRIYQAELEIQNEELKQSQSMAENLLRRFSTLFNALPLPAFVIDAAGVILDVNFIGLHTFKPRSKPTLEYFPRLVMKENHLQLSRLLQETQRNGASCVLGVKLKTNDHSPFVGDIFASRLPVSPETPQMHEKPSIALLIVNRTQELQYQNQLKLAASVFDSSQEGMIVTDAGCTIIQVNEAFSRISGYSREEVLGRQPKFLQSGRHDMFFYDQMWQSIKLVGSWQGEIWNRHKSGDIYPQHLAISAVQNAAGTVVNYIGVFVDITHQKKTEEEIAKLAFYDPLTNLPNRRMFKDRLAQAILSSSRNAYYAALLFIDLDDFKTINDTLGHDLGDELLVNFATRLFSCVREVDTVARLGGDEFVIILENLDKREVVATTIAEMVAKKILQIMHEPFMLNHQKIHCSCSIGVTIFLKNEHPQDELLKQADLAMYQSKKTGKNAVFFYDPKLQVAVNTSLLVHNELQGALENSQVELFYQMIVDVDQHAVGAEALVRWHHPTKGLILPGEFIPVAEETGLISLLGVWTIHQACKQLKLWETSAATARLVMSVNISAKQIEHVDFVLMVKSVIEQYRINPSRLSFELTENTLINNIEGVIEKMRELKALGLGLSLDDFGTGYSSLKYLSILPVDYIKIDQSFVRDISPGKNKNSIITAVIAIARSLDMTVISEGVETSHQFEYLIQEGSSLFQGYYFAEPVPVKQFEQNISTT